MTTTSTDNNSNLEIPLKLRDKLKSRGIIEKFVINKKHKYIKIELNYKDEKITIVISTIHAEKNWTEFQESIKKELNRLEVYDKEDIRLIQNVIDDNHKRILGLPYDNDKDNYNNNHIEGTNKTEFVVYKYSQMGKGPLHEAVIVNGLPYFLKYNHDSNTFKVVEKIEENGRIIRPPNIEEYPYTPYSFESIEELQFFMQKARKVTLDELFKYSKTKFLRYVDQDEYIINLLGADAIWTYFQDLFPATHYSEGVGTNDVGKSSIGYTFEYTGYRVIKGTAISGANYNRVLGNIEPGQCTIIEDEGDNISEDSEKVKILKAGYEYNIKIPKTNMNTTKQEQKWYFPYCYKMILAEKSLKEYKAKGLVDRTFSFSCKPGKVKYSIKEVVSQNINKSPRLQRLYNELLSFRKLMLCYRLIHYKDPLPEIETGLKNRDNELCKPLLQLFYGTDVLNKDIIPTLEIFVKQRRTRKANSLDATLYSIIKKFVFSEAGLDYETNTYTELKQKKKTVKVPFYRIWDYIIGKEGFKAGIDGQYDQNKKYQYETIDYGTLYLNSLPTTIREKFTATTKNEDYGRALIFDIEKLEKFEDMYSNSHLKGDNVKIEVKLKTAEEDGDSGDSEDFGDFLSVRSHILDKSQLQQDNTTTKNNNNNTLSPNEDKVESSSNSNFNNKNNIYACLKSQKSPESPESSVINNQEEDEEI